MPKVQSINNKTHAYILPEYDGVVVRAISPTHVKEYQDEKKTVYSCVATKTVDGSKIDTENFYVSVADFVKRQSTRVSVASKLSAIVSTQDLSTMTALELAALLA